METEIIVDLLKRVERLENSLNPKPRIPPIAPEGFEFTGGYREPRENEFEIFLLTVVLGLGMIFIGVGLDEINSTLKKDCQEHKYRIAELKKEKPENEEIS